MSLKVVILAAGQGTRMRSTLPKVLHPLANKPMLQWVLEEADALQPKEIMVVVGHCGEQVKNTLPSANVTWVEQTAQLGTGHALQQTLPHLQDCEQVLVLLGDTPMITEETLRELCESTPVNQLGIITEFVGEPAGLGRIIRDAENNLIGIVEEKDATLEQKTIEEINTGIMLLPVKYLQNWLQALSSSNAQNEFYLTDVIAMAVTDKVSINSIQPLFTEEVLGINNRQQLAYLERFYQSLIAQTLMEEGVTLMDPDRFNLRGDLDVAQDVVIDINVIIEGDVKIARGCHIGANSILKNVSLGENVTVLPNSILEDSIVAANCTIGPFARLRPGTELAEGVKVGNFVETKKVKVGKGSKLSHLSYIGDANIGANVNIGAGTITCNYDGINKYVTTIEDDVFIGSDSQLIAPVTIEKGAYIGAGSSISKNAPAGKLTLARARQKTIDSWQPPKK